MSEIAKFCDVVVLVDRGNTVLYDDVKEGIAAYQLQANPDAKPAPTRTAAAPAPGAVGGSGGAKAIQAPRSLASADQT
jgi:hypothetical protein